MKKLLMIALPFVSALVAASYAPIAEVQSNDPAFNGGPVSKTGSNLFMPSTYSLQARLTVTPQVGLANGGVAVSGNTAVVFSSAGYYVYVRSGVVWNQQAVLVPSDGTGVFGPFGPFPVAIDGDTIVFGAPNATINSNANQGAAYVFVRNGSIWTEQQRLTAGDGAAGNAFGNSVAISGETIIAGAYTATVGGAVEQGAAYVFVRNDTSWSQQTKLLADDGGARNTFGKVVDVSGDSVVVTRGYRTSAVVPNPAAYVFVRNSTTWSQQQKLSVCEPSGNGGVQCDFGTSISIEGDKLAVGNQFLNLGSNNAQGGVYLFTRSGTIWSQQQRLTANDGGTDGLFGSAVSIEENTLLVGAKADLGVAGSAYIFGLTGGVWTQGQKLSVTTTRDAFGQFASMSGNTLLIASPVEQAAYIFTTGTVTPMIHSPFDFDGDGKTDPSVYRPSMGDWYLLNTTTGFRALHFGLPSDIMVPADYTGDGKTDIAVWRPSDSIWYILRSEDNTFFGVGFGANGDIPAPGDYDGDGRSDFVVIRPGATQSFWFLQQTTAGFAVVPFGLAGDLPTLGDYDGDGKNDVAVYRPSNGAWFRFNSSNGSFLGVGFGISGDKVVPADYTGDGKTDLAVFRPSNNIWFILRSEDNSLTGGAFGSAGDLPSPGDYDGDGKTDLAVYRLGATPGAQSIFYVLQTTAGFNTIPWGLGEDRPVPGAYVY